MKGRLDRELVGNVSIHVLPTERPDTWEVQGRGELQLAVLVEIMRREGFELTVGKPQVLTKEIDGKVHEPVDRLTIDVPEDYLGVVTQLLALRKGRMEQIINHGTGWVRMEYLVPARGLIGFRTEFITETRGTGLLHHVFERMEPWAGEIKGRPNGSLVADRLGPTTGFALTALQDRGVMFVGPGVPVYEGMIVGENSRADDMDINPTKEKKLNNIRSSTAEAFEKLIPPRTLSLEQALELIAEDECVEVTPASRAPAQGRPRPDPARPQRQASQVRRLIGRSQPGVRGRPVGVGASRGSVAALGRLVGHVGEAGGLAGEELLADQPVVDEVEAVLEHPLGGGALAVDLGAPLERHPLEVGVRRPRRSPSPCGGRRRRSTRRRGRRSRGRTSGRPAGRGRRSRSRRRSWPRRRRSA